MIIDRNGNLVVRAPRRASITDIERFILQKRHWIERKSLEAAGRKPAARKFESGERFLFLGQERVLRITEDYRSKLHYDGEFELSRHKAVQARSLFEQWYRGQAKTLLPQRVAFFAGKMSASPGQITVTGARSRWGSCSAKNTLNFSWRLVMAPLDIVDYVVVHELAHTIHHDHSRKFWRKVQEYFPDFYGARKWLDDNGHHLSI